MSRYSVNVPRDSIFSGDRKTYSEGENITLTELVMFCSAVLEQAFPLPLYELTENSVSSIDTARTHTILAILLCNSCSVLST